MSTSKEEKFYKIYAKIDKNKELPMLSLTINDPTIEEFYKKECNEDENKFISSFVHYIETYNIKKSLKQGLKEVALQNSGQIEKKELKHIIDEL